MVRTALSLEDLRGGFNRLAEHEQAASNAVAPQPAKRPFMTEGRTKLFRDMLFERFEAEEAQRRFEFAMDGITKADEQGKARAEFDKFFTWLKAQPKLTAQAAKPAAPVQQAIEGTTPLIEGKFTVVFDDESYKTLRVRRQREDAKFMPGRMLVGHLTGSDNEADYTNVGHVAEDGRVVIWKKHQGNAKLAEAVRVLVGDPRAAAQAYAEHSGSCSKCGRTLTVPASLNAGLGPECAKKVGW